MTDCTIQEALTHQIHATNALAQQLQAARDESMGHVSDILSLQQQLQAAQAELASCTRAAQEHCKQSLFWKEQADRVGEQLAASQREVADLRSMNRNACEALVESQREGDRLAAENAELGRKFDDARVIAMRLQKDWTRLQAEVADYKKTVSKIWEILGNPSYDSLQGKSIFDLITGLQASLDKATGLLKEAKKAWDAKDGQLLSHFPSGHKWKGRLDAFLTEQCACNDVTGPYCKQHDTQGYYG